MSINVVKTGFMAAAFALVLAGCSGSSNDTQPVEDPNANTAPVVEETPVEVVDVAANAATVFYFEYDKAILKPEARAALDLHAQSLNNNPRSIRLEGHADERGTREYNIALGERRANAVKDYLVVQGVNPSSIEVISYGEERPALSGSNDSAWAMNRRVELK